ncbi:MAG: calcium-binding protein, partial [Symploca sp. SIO1B1]|nr:calcium-binding protein [Symploca sp. SIO1B1]
MNNYSLIGTEGLEEFAQVALEAAILKAQDLLKAIASGQDFTQKFTIAFGNDFDLTESEYLRQQWEEDNFESLPDIEIRSSAAINGAHGAFSADTNTIYLSQEYLTQNASSPQAIANLLLEEIGHSVDSQINTSDASGDEGAIFSALAQGVQLEEGTLQALKAENDLTTVTLDGEVIQIEQAEPTFNVSDILSGLKDSLDNIQNKVNALFEGKEIPNTTGITGSGLPFLGNDFTEKAQEGGQFVQEFYDKIEEKFKSLLGSATEVTQSQIQDVLFEAFGSSGLNILKDSNGNGIGKDDIKIDVNSSGALTVDFDLGGKSSLTSVALPKNLGLPQLGLEFQGETNLGVDLDYTFDFGFDFNPNSNDKFFFNLNTDPNDKEITIKVTPNIPKTSANFGFLKVDATDMGTGLNFSLNLSDGNNDNKLKLGESLNYTPAGSADIKLNLATSFDTSVKLPSISSDFNLSWSFTENGAAPKVAFENTQLDLGTFFKDFAKPVLKNINKVIDPIRPLINGLTTNIDFLTNELPRGLNSATLLDFEKEVTPGDVTLLDLLKAIDKYGRELEDPVYIPGLDESLDFFKAVKKVDKLIQEVDELIALNSDSKNGQLYFENFDLNILDVNDSNSIDIRLDDFSFKDLDLDTILDTNQNLQNSSASDFINNLSEDLKFPILTNPQRVFEFLLGKPEVELFTYDMPELKLKADISDVVKIPLLPPLFATFGTNLAATIDLDFGYDTYGLENLSSIDDAFDGFFIKDPNGKDKADITLSGGIRGGISLDVEAIELNGGANIGAEVAFFLADGSDDDGKLRVSEIEQGWFDKITGEVFAFLDARAEIPIGQALQDLVTGPVEDVTAVTGYFRDITEDAGLLGDGFELLDKGANFIKDGIEAVGDALFGDEEDESNGPSFVLFEVKTPRQTLWSFDLLTNDSDPILANLLANPEGDQLWLNIGERAKFRVNVDKEDGSETFKVTQQSGAGIQVSALGYTQNYSIPDKIIANAGQGNDFISIEADVSAELDGGVGDDELYGGTKNDILKGGENNDYLDGGSGEDSLYGQGGEDRLKGGDNNDYLDGGSENDQLSGDDGHDILNGGDGADYLNGGEGDDSLDGGNQNDQLFGVGGEDTLIGGEGEDYLDGGTENDRLFGQAGNDTLWGGTDADYLDGGTENDRLFGQAGDDTLIGGNGQDLLAAGVDNDYLDGGDQNDWLFGESGNDTLYGGEGDDTLDGYNGNDFFVGGAGDDLIEGGNDIDTVSYQNSHNGVIVNIDETQNYQNPDVANSSHIEPHFTINAGTAKDGFGTTDTLRNLENIIGSEFNDILIGNNQNNRIEASTGNDLLIGNAGNDYLDGGDNIDTVSYRHDSGSVYVNLDETQSYQNPGGYLHTTIVSDSPIPTDTQPNFTLNAGTALDGFGDTDELRNLENLVGSGYDDVLIGNDSDNQIEGLAGNDLLIGNSGDDQLNGSDGIDTVSYHYDPDAVYVNLEQNQAQDGFGNSDQLHSIENVVGSAFDDEIIGDANTNIIHAGAGDDLVIARDNDDIIFGEAGKDTLFGEQGDDFLVGGTEADILDGGSGNDTASYFTANSGVIANLTTGKGATGDARGDIFESIENLEGSHHKDRLIGDNLTNILSGLDGNDFLDGRAGDDYLDGGAGRDQLAGNAGNDQLYGQAGDDDLDGGTGDDQLFGGDGHDLLEGQAGNDILDGGEGDDYLLGEYGADTLFG